MGKAIYKPKGKAGEYAEYACNFYVGCSNGCDYCYCKKGRSAKWLGGDTPTLKKHFRDEDHALEIFKKELVANLPELQKHGLFFSFTTDPMIDETVDLTMSSAEECIKSGIPIKILTKNADYPLFCLWGGVMGAGLKQKLFQRNADNIAVGFTLTGHDELESNASTNAERIEAMQKLHNAGFKTFASIEPIIDIPHSKLMIENSIGFCNLYKIGVESGKRYPKKNLTEFVNWVLNSSVIATQPKIYFKDSLLKQAGIDRSTLPANCVKAGYNIFQK